MERHPDDDRGFGEGESVGSVCGRAACGAFGSSNVNCDSVLKACVFYRQAGASLHGIGKRALTPRQGSWTGEWYLVARRSLRQRGVLGHRARAGGTQAYQ